MFMYKKAPSLKLQRRRFFDLLCFSVYYILFDYVLALDNEHGYDHKCLHDEIHRYYENRTEESHEEKGIKDLLVSRKLVVLSYKLHKGNEHEQENVKIRYGGNESKHRHGYYVF